MLDVAAVHIQTALRELTNALRAAVDADTIGAVLDETARLLGCRYFALSHHVDFGVVTAGAIRLHNYPDGWVEWFDARGLGVVDPVHRASQRSVAGFLWRDVPAIIGLTSADRRVLAHALERGIGEGFTVPANVPGEFLGSCSFASARGDDLDEAMIPLAQWVGLFAFEAARRCGGLHKMPPSVVITDRQRDCVLWLARGKTDWEISRILGVSHATVIAHVKDARARYDAPNRALLTVRTLYDGSLSFADILMR